MGTSKRYLIIAPAWVGDMIMAQSLFRYLKQLEPDCKIDVVAPKTSAPLAQFMPEINQCHTADFKHGQFSLLKRFNYGKRLKHYGYTHSITLPNSWKSAIIPYGCKIKHRIGWKGEFRYGLINDIRRLDKTRYPLMIERFCALALAKNQPLPAKLPYPAFAPPETLVKQTLAKYSPELNQPIIALCPGAEYGPAKKWPSAYYAQAANDLINRGYTIWLFGSPADKETTNAIIGEIDQSNQNNIKDFAGQTSLPEAIALLNNVAGVISNDSGLMHIACALNKKTLVIYGSSSDQFTPPLNEHARSIYLEGLSCRPCFERTCPLKHMNCLNQLKPQHILSAFDTLMAA